MNSWLKWRNIMEPCWIFPICSRNYLLASHARRLRARGYVSLTTDNHQLLVRNFAALFLESFKNQICVSLRQGDWWTLSVNELTISAESFVRRRVRRIFGEIIHSGSDYKEQFGLFLAIVCISSASVPRHHHCQRAPAPITGGNWYAVQNLMQEPNDPQHSFFKHAPLVIHVYICTVYENECILTCYMYIICILHTYLYEIIWDHTSSQLWVYSWVIMGKKVTFGIVLRMRMESCR